MSFNSKNNQTDKKALQVKDKANAIKKNFKTEKSSEKSRKEKKNKGC